MAKPTTIIEKETEQPTLNLDVLLQQFLEKREAISELMDVVQLLHERGMLRVLRSALERYDDLIQVLGDWLGAMGESSPTRLFELLNALTKIDAQSLTALLESVSEGVKAAQNQPTPSMFAVLRRLDDEKVRKGLQVLLEILGKLGSTTDHEA